LQKKDLKYRSY